MALQQKVIAAAAVAVLALVVTFAGLAVQMYRYSYELQGREGSQYFIRTDRLTGESCYAPVGVAGYRVASQILVIPECEP